MANRSDSAVTLLFRALCMIMVAWAIAAWSAMIAVGVLHNDWWTFIPPMGFATAMKFVAPAFFIALFSKVVSQMSK